MRTTNTFVGAVVTVAPQPPACRRPLPRCLPTLVSSLREGGAEGRGRRVGEGGSGRRLGAVEQEGGASWCGAAGREERGGGGEVEGSGDWRGEKRD